jgi:chorismate mutase
MRNKPMDLVDLRLRGDYLTEQIMLGLRTRSKFSLNMQTFSEIFHDNKTWFMYRLKKEQDLDSEFGRYLYNQQNPFLFKKEELSKSLVKEQLQTEGFEGIELNHSKEIIELYKKMLYEICADGDDRATYGETTKIDVDLVLVLNERIVSFGQQVAWTKIHTISGLTKETNSDKIREIIVSREREEEVVKNAVSLAQKHGLTNIESIKDFTKVLINFTTQIEIETILLIQQNNLLSHSETK